MRSGPQTEERQIRRQAASECNYSGITTEIVVVRGHSADLPVRLGQLAGRANPSDGAEVIRDRPAAALGSFSGNGTN